MKRIHTETIGDKAAKFYRDSDRQEYRVRLYIHGELHAPADYHTGDKADAITTAAAMVRPDTRAVAPVNVAFNVAVLHIAGRVMPCGFDVSPNAPQTLDSLMAHHDKTGRVLVWNGASDKTIFADAGVNYAFRAWHDSKHIIGRFPFNHEGEFLAMSAQLADINAIYDGPTARAFCNLLEAEIMGQFHYKEARGGFPIDQASFVRAYVSDQRRALLTDFGVSTEAA